MLMYFTDDIPIQVSDDTLNQSALLSISEETEGGESQLGTRNNLVRSSKEILKTHKVPFSGFKKLKDKEKDKDKDGATSTASSRSQSSKNGSILNMDGMKESVIVAATKQLTRKEKKNSLQMNSIDASDASVHADKASPLLQIKRKSSSVDVNGPSHDIVQMQPFTNGNSIIVEEKRTVDAIADDVVGEIEKMADAVISQRTSLIVDQNGKTSTTNNNMQISQV